MTYSESTEHAARTRGNLCVALAVLTAGCAVAAMLFAPGADAATVTVSPGQSIHTAILNAAPGDTIIVKAGTYAGGFNVNKPLSLISETPRAAKLTGTTTQSAITIGADGVTIDGFYMDSFADGVASWNVNRNNVTVKNCYMGDVQYGVVATGDNWTIEGNEIYRIRMWNAGDANGIWGFGRNHLVRNNYFHGTRLGDGINQSEICPAGYTAYDAGPCAHVDFFQSYTEGGRIADGFTIEGNYATDFIDAVYTNDLGTGYIANFTIRNNVFIGTPYKYKDANTPLETRTPAWGLAFAYGTGGEGLQVIENNLLYNISLPLRLNDGTKARVSRNIFARAGQVYTLENNSWANVTIPVGGNLWWQIQSYQVNAQPAADKQAGCTVLSGTDACTSDPRFVAIANPLGADGKPWTADDGWVSQVAGYGPQLAVAPTPTPDPTPTPEPPVDGDVLTPGQAAEVQQMIDAELDALAATLRAEIDVERKRVDVLSAWKKLFPQTTRRFKDSGGIWRNAPSN